MTTIGPTEGHRAPWRKTDRRMPAKPPAIPEPLLIAEWKKNRYSDVIRIMLRTYEGVDLVDIRSWWNDQHGQCKPGKGISLRVNHLKQLIKALQAALLKASELGLIDGASK